MKKYPDIIVLPFAIVAAVLFVALYSLAAVASLFVWGKWEQALTYMLDGR